MSSPRLWIDLDNSPHVPLYAPLIRHLEKQGWQLIVTARDFAQTLDLVAQLGVDAIPVGRHAGRSKVRKVANLPVRALQLVSTVRSFKPQIALSHGSRTQTLAARLLGIPSIVMFDYEWTEMSIFSRLATHLACPSMIGEQRLRDAGIPLEKVSHYEGFKEDLYLPEFRPDPGFRRELGVMDDEMLITVRPPGLIGNYHDERSEAICRRLLERVATIEKAVVVVLPKTSVERALVDDAIPQGPAARFLLPEHAIPGLQLLFWSDLAVSGGGTMNREAALLGTTAFSMFTGRKAAIDEELANRSLLTFLGRPEDVDAIDFSVRRRRVDWQPPATRLVYDVEAMVRKFSTSH